MYDVNKGLILFLINPISGNGKWKKVFPKVEEYLLRNNINYAKRFTEYKGHTFQIVEEIKNRTDIKAVVAVGGDGTLSEIINSFNKLDIPIGYIPTGTGNDFGREMGIPKDPVLALERILEMDIKSIDIGKINDNFFVNVASMGFDAEVAKFANESMLKRIGKFIYVLGVIKSLWSFKPISAKITIDDKEHIFDKTWLIAIANNRYYGGGMMISPNSVNDDGYFEICVINNISKLTLLRLFPTIFQGKHINHSAVKVLKGKSIKVDTPKTMAVQTDGEISANDQLIITNINKGIKVL